MPKIKINRWLSSTVLTTAIAVSLMACQSTSTENTTKSEMNINKTTPLTVERIYKDNEFSSDSISRLRWLVDGSGYTVLEKSATTKMDDKGENVSIGNDIVVYDPETLEKSVLISAEQLTPNGADKPLAIHNYTWSDDRKKLLVYTNSKKVWRSNSRGDYWLLDIKTNKLNQLGGKKSAESSLMFAKFSPDASKVAYVVADNIYVENLSDNKVSQLTFDAGDGKINGLFDWVYEEEFTIKDGFRWSPDGKKIAYWQLDTSGSKDFIMINNTDELYPTITKFPYPKVGEINALPKVGVVNLATAKTTWANLPNNSRNMYIPRMNWSGNSQQILVQHVNRKQDTNILYLANANSGDVTPVMTEQEATFLDFFDDARL